MPNAFTHAQSIPIRFQSILLPHHAVERHHLSPSSFCVSANGRYHGIVSRSSWMKSSPRPLAVEGVTIAGFLCFTDMTSRKCSLLNNAILWGGWHDLTFFGRGIQYVTRVRMPENMLDNNTYRRMGMDTQKKSCIKSSGHPLHDISHSVTSELS